MKRSLHSMKEDLKEGKKIFINRVLCASICNWFDFDIGLDYVLSNSPPHTCVPILKQSAFNPFALQIQEVQSHQEACYWRRVNVVKGLMWDDAAYSHHKQQFKDLREHVKDPANLEIIGYKNHQLPRQQTTNDGKSKCSAI